jgi:hypothetical protein
LANGPPRQGFTPQGQLSEVPRLTFRITVERENLHFQICACCKATAFRQKGLSQTMPHHAGYPWSAKNPKKNFGFFANVAFKQLICSMNRREERSF